MSKSTKRAFSLIELMVVIAIVSILAALAVPTYKTYLERARMKVAYGVINSELAVWQKQQSLGNWYTWGPSQAYRTDETGTFYEIYMNWQWITFYMNPGKFGRETETQIVYLPIVDGVPAYTLPNAHAMDNADVIRWACFVTAPPYYYGGMTVEDFQKAYFPNCTYVF